MARRGGAVDQMPVTREWVDQIAGVGLDVAELFARAGWSPPSGRSQTVWPTSSAYFELWRVLERADAEAGLRLGTLTYFGMAGSLALQAADWGEAIARLARCVRIVRPEHLTVRRSGDEVKVGSRWPLADARPPSALVDAMLTAIVAFTRHGTGRSIRPRRVEYRRSRTAGPYRRHFGCPVVFGAPHDGVVFADTLLNERLIAHDTELRALFWLGDGDADSGDWRTEVRSTLARNLCRGRPAVAKLAATLGTSPRTLQRRLEQSGTTYQRVLDELRYQSAKRLLRLTDWRLIDISLTLGFEELNSFGRAFHGWEGTTPSRYRSLARVLGG